MRYDTTKEEINKRIEEYEKNMTKNQPNLEDLVDKHTRDRLRDWAKWSLTKHSFDEIREKCLTDFNNVCFTYVCETSPIPEENFLEFAALSTGLITKDNYTDTIKPMINIMKHFYKIRKATKKELNWYFNLYYGKTYSANKTLVKLEASPYEAIEDLIFDRMDWVGLCTINDFSEEFLAKYADFVEWKYIPVYRKYSKEFAEKFKDKIHVRNDNIEENTDYDE